MKIWIQWMITKRRWVVAGTLLVTALFMSQLKNLSIIIDPDDALPQSHPYLKVNNEVERIFGNKFTVVIGVTANQGDVFQTPILKKVKSITDQMLALPGTVKSNVNSLSARKAKSISGDQEGMTVRPLMEKVPENAAEMERLKVGLASNPVYENLLISPDRKTTQIVAEFKKIPGGFKAIDDQVRKIVDNERDPSVDLTVGGLPTFLSLLERYSQRMGFLFPIAVLIIGLIHYEAFRTVQALILPLVTALVAVVWAVGILALLGQPMDVFNASTPILILAIAAGHAVQILKRYYEEYSSIREQSPMMPPAEMNKMAVLASLTKVGPVMVVACLVAALGFFSLMIFEIKSIRTFGVFTGSGVVSALILELTFIPALRSMLPAPSEKEYRREKQVSFWDRLTGALYGLSVDHRKKVYLVSGMAIVILSLGGYWLKIENSQKSYFYGKIPARLEDDKINERMAGTNTLYTFVDTQKEDGIKNPEVLHAMEKMQEFFSKEAPIGKTVSIVDFIKRMNQSMNADKKEFYQIPDNSDLVAQYLLLYSNSGEPGDFDSYVDYGYQKAIVQVFTKVDNSTYIDDVAKRAKAYADSVFPAGVQVSIGGGATGGVALNEVMIHEKVLNILQIMAAVFLVSSFVFRSFLAGALILVPLVAAVFVNFGVMGLLGIPLQIATALVSAMAVGIGADYGIYMSYRMREELRSGRPEKEAIERAFRSAGKATLFVSSAVAGGFGVLIFSWGFMIHIWMGFLIATAMLVSSFTALTVFPSLILTLRPTFIFDRRKEKREMKMASIGMGLLSMGLLGGGGLEVRAESLTPDQIAKKSFLTSKVMDSTSDSTFRLVNGNGQERVRETQGQTKLIPGTTDNRRVVTFLSPSDIKGTKTLLVEHSEKDDDIWIYLPALKKVRRLVANNKKDSFVGTDFSYSDVIGQKVEEWNHILLKEEKIDGRDCYVIEATPKKPETGENSGYAKSTSWIDKASFVAVQAEFHNGGGILYKRIRSKNIQKVDDKKDKWQPMLLEAENLETGHKTVIEFKNYKANVGVSDEVFTTRYLEKR